LNYATEQSSSIIIWKVTCEEGVVNTIARLGLVDGGPKEVEANARLIASSPDLYCALSSMIDLFDGYSNGTSISDKQIDQEETLKYARKILAEAIIQP
jgi:hypothetical protein